MVTITGTVRDVDGQSTPFSAVADVTTGGLPAGVTLKPIDGGPTYYADKGFTYAVGMGWDNPAYFPIAIWNPPIDTQADADRMIDLRVNTLAAIGPSWMDASYPTRIQNNGFALIASDDERTFFSSSVPYWVGNISGDEATTFAGGISSDAASVPNAKQDHRWWWYNGNWFFFNPLNSSGGLSPYEADVALKTNVTTPNGTQRHIDLASTDLYWFAGAKGNVGWVLGAGQSWYGLSSMNATQAKRACHYGDAVDKMRAVQAGGFPAPIGNFIENGGCYTENTTSASYPFPDEMNAAVWSCIIHGARWICYFNHSFGGPGVSGGGINTNNFGSAYYQVPQAGQPISIYAQAKATNTLVKSLAPVINSPFAIGYVTVSPPGVKLSASAADSGFDVMAKWSNSQFYIFAMTRYPGATTNQTATFTIKNTGAQTVTVVNENRTIPVTSGTTFADTFATGNTVHIYKVG